jgi:hypothetical protein
MRTLLVGTALFFCLAAAASAADGPAPCETINAARRSGVPVVEVAQRFETTRARVAACARVARSRATATARRQRVAAARAARAR